MKPITLEQYRLTRDPGELTEAQFDLLAQKALSVTQYLCFERADRNESEAAKAMEAMIAAWIREETDAEERKTARDITHETVGNYSVTYSRRDNGETNGPAFTILGLTVSPEAVMILDNAGLREHAV